MLSSSRRAGRKWIYVSDSLKLCHDLENSTELRPSDIQYLPHSCQILWHLSVKILLSVIFIFGLTKRTEIHWTLFITAAGNLNTFSHFLLTEEKYMKNFLSLFLGKIQYWKKKCENCMKKKIAYGTIKLSV